MPWHPDVPDLPIKKPKIIETLEQMDRSVLDSMPPVEVQEMVDAVASGVAEAYKEQYKKGNYEECVEFASIALSVTGSALGGQMGKAMIASSEHAAKNACSIVFPVEE